MDLLHRLCLWICGLCLMVITLIIPWGVYTRYVLGYGSSWPEPMAVLLMILNADGENMFSTAPGERTLSGEPNTRRKTDDGCKKGAPSQALGAPIRLPSFVSRPYFTTLCDKLMWLAA